MSFLDCKLVFVSIRYYNSICVANLKYNFFFDKLIENKKRKLQPITQNKSSQHGDIIFKEHATNHALKMQSLLLKIANICRSNGHKLNLFNNIIIIDR